MGPYDSALRGIIATHPRSLAEFLLSESLAGCRVRYGPTELAGETLRADAVIAIDNSIAHVEFQYRAAPADMSLDSSNTGADFAKFIAGRRANTSSSWILREES